MSVVGRARRSSAGLLALSAAAMLGGCTTTTSAPSADTSSAVSSVRSKYPEPVDLAEARAKCLTKAGWAVSVQEDASISVDLKPGTEADYRHDDDQCLKRLGIDPDASPSRTQLRQAYEASVQGAACLREGGWTISTAPTFDTFEDHYDSDPWYPWAEVPDEDFAEAARSCPTPEPTY